MNTPPTRHYPLEFEITFCVRGVISPVLANLFLHLHLRLVDEAGLSPPPLGVGMRMTDWFTVGPSKKPQPSRLHFNLAWQSAS
jgi:hypothetical protein